MAADGSRQPQRTANESERLGAPPARRRHNDESLNVHIEFVVLDGEAGRALARRQAAVIRQVLQWVNDHPAAGVAHDANVTDGTV